MLRFRWYFEHYSVLSPDIAMGVDTGGAWATRAWMFAWRFCDETPELMPPPIMMAHKLVRQQSDVRRDGKLTYLRPDAKSQVSVEYVDGKPKPTPWFYRRSMTTM